MELLRFIEGFRTPLLDGFFGLITQMGGETVLIFIALFLLWCVDKKEGLYVFSVGYLGLIVTQFLKITVRMERPWVRDISFNPVNSAIADAKGYSFPSGHSQISVGVYGSMIRFLKNRALKIICISLSLLVPFSRLYLGVHTLYDVLCGVGISIILIFLMRSVINKNYDSIKRMNIVFLIMSILNIIYLLYVSLYPFPKDIDIVNLEDAVINGYKMLGVVFGLWVSYVVDKLFINYKTSAPLWAQLIKFIGGAAVFMLVRVLLKAYLPYVIENSLFEGTVRYFILVALAGCVWPLTFGLFGEKKK